MNLLANPTLGGEQLIKNNLEILLIDLMRSLTETEDGNDVFLQETEINNKIAEDIIKILKNNVYKRLTVEDISKMVSYSKAYVFRQFKLATGKGVMEYYTELKIKTAKQLIKENELSVKEISERLCFDTPNYFSKTFKKAVGETPTQYRTRVLS
jgi:AraC-like DNA-binding protein